MTKAVKALSILLILAALFGVAASGAVLCAAGIACAVLTLMLRKSENE